MKWEEIEIPCDNGANDVVVSSSNDSVMFLATDCGILKTTDSGLNWTNVYPLPAGNDTTAYEIQVHPLDSNHIISLLLEGTNGFLLKSTDGGNQ